MGDELSRGQAQNGVNFDFEFKFVLEGQGQSPPKTIGILPKVFYTYGPNLVILAWTGDELSRGQTWWRTDGRTQATTIPEGQYWPRVKTEIYDDVIKWKHFSRHWPFVRGNNWTLVNSPHKGQWHGTLMFTLICAWINGWVNTREAGDVRRHRAHYDVTVCFEQTIIINSSEIRQAPPGSPRPNNSMWHDIWAGTVSSQFPTAQAMIVLRTDYHTYDCVPYAGYQMMNSSKSWQLHK